MPPNGGQSMRIKYTAEIIVVFMTKYSFIMNNLVRNCTFEQFIITLGHSMRMKFTAVK